MPVNSTDEIIKNHGSFKRKYEKKRKEIGGENCRREL